MKYPNSSLSIGEQEGMKCLAKRIGIIITTADKVGEAVILDTENYIKETNCQLSDKNNYKTLQTDSTLQHNKMVYDTLDQFKNENLLSKRTEEGLKMVNPKIPEFYIPPKIHKENKPGRLAINSINCHTYETSHFVNHDL